MPLEPRVPPPVSRGAAGVRGRPHEVAVMRFTVYALVRGGRCPRPRAPGGCGCALGRQVGLLRPIQGCSACAVRGAALAVG